jgi:hypothetical protein
MLAFYFKEPRQQTMFLTSKVVVEGSTWYAVRCEKNDGVIPQQLESLAKLAFNKAAMSDDSFDDVRSTIMACVQFHGPADFVQSAECDKVLLTPFQRLNLRSVQIRSQNRSNRNA